MHALARHSLRASTPPNLIIARPCRYIAGRRFPSAVRTFQTSRARLDIHNGENNSPDSTWSWNPIKGVSEEATADNDPKKPEDEAESLSETGLPRESTTTEASESKVSENIPKSINLGNYGSQRNRMLRNARRSKETQIPPPPDWFLTNNVLLHTPHNDSPGDIEIVGSLETPASIGQRTKGKRKLDENDVPQQQPNNDQREGTIQGDEAEISSPSPTVARYKVDRHIYDEIHALVLAGLRAGGLPRQEDLSISKPHIVLQSPKAGGAAFLTSLAQTIADDVGADVIKVDAQDIAEIAATLPDSPELGHSSAPLRSLGYDVHIVDSDMEAAAAEENESSDEGLEDGEYENSFSKGLSDFGSSKPSKTPFASSKPWKSGSNPQSYLKSFKLFSIPYLYSASLNPLLGSQSTNPTPSASGATKTQSDAGDEKLQHPEVMQNSLLFDSFLKLPWIKRQAAHHDLKAAPDNPGQGSAPVHDLIVILQDYLELQTTQHGGAVLDRLNEAVRRQWKEGQRVIIVGVSTAEDLLPSLTKSGFRKLQTDTRQGAYRTVITTCKNEDVESIFKEDEKLRIRHINTRHVQDMLRRLAPPPSQIEAILSKKPSDIVLDSASVFSSGLEETVWSLDRVHRVASIALGLVSAEDQMTTEHITAALETIRSSDQSKFDWLDSDVERTTREKTLSSASTTSDPSDLKADLDERMRKLRKSCTTHERKLLSGVIDPSDLHTTFSDVCAQPHTIEALKSLTSLSLIRPDAFTYGVLATDKIPGLLLYGPPGTGKTLLAKAVAKESGATVLEVSGSDINDMYVGEGEKNVRALFTLARKLSPCVVFIDEADAIFGLRSGSVNRTSHRELINQFLREWDGMHSGPQHAAFIMVATNRPFDLDDAVLRRLPRRLMIDLPTARDREAILGIHLKGEQLEDGVKLAELAERTPFYSGSDLKNLCVSAALACVREENEIAAATDAEVDVSMESKSTGKEKVDESVSSADVAAPTYPAKRILKQAHFDQALSEISASVSEDMSSLAAVRKFDEQYGDRRGKKKRGGMGFNMGRQGKDSKERDEEERVKEREREKVLEREAGRDEM